MPATESVQDQVLEPAALSACDSLNSRVEGVKHRHRFSFLTSGIFLALAVVVAIFLAFSAADILLKLSVSSRIMVSLATVLSIAGVIAWAVVRPWRRVGGSIQVARSVEKVYPVGSPGTELEFAL